MDGLDGELIVGNWTDPHVYNKSNSGINSKHGEPDFTYYVFDHKGYSDFKDRYANLEYELDGRFARVVLLKQLLVHNLEELRAYEAEILGLGFEGVIVRVLTGKYKHGRATAKQNIVFKLKRFTDDEGILISIEEQMKNNNAAIVNELGYTTRSSHKANKSGKGTTGKFVVMTKEFGHVELGAGNATKALLQDVWDNFEQYKGRIVVWKYFKVGMIDRPRHPTFKGWRDKDDLES